MRHKKLKAAFNTYRNYVESLFRTHRIAKRSLAYWKNRALAGVFNAWRAAFLAQKSAEHVAARALAHWHKAKFAAAFNTWLAGTRLANKKLGKIRLGYRMLLALAKGNPKGMMKVGLLLWGEFVDWHQQVRLQMAKRWA